MNKKDIIMQYEEIEREKKLGNGSSIETRQPNIAPAGIVVGVKNEKMHHNEIGSSSPQEDSEQQGNINSSTGRRPSIGASLMSSMHIPRGNSVFHLNKDADGALSEKPDSDNINASTGRRPSIGASLMSSMHIPRGNSVFHLNKDADGALSEKPDSDNINSSTGRRPSIGASLMSSMHIPRGNSVFHLNKDAMSRSKGPDRSATQHQMSMPEPPAPPAVMVDGVMVATAFNGSLFKTPKVAEGKGKSNSNAYISSEQGYRRKTCKGEQPEQSSDSLISIRVPVGPRPGQQVDFKYKGQKLSFILPEEVEPGTLIKIKIPRSLQTSF